MDEDANRGGHEHRHRPVLSPAAFGQVNANQTNNVPSCAKVQRSGRRIVSNLEIVEFYVPRFAHVTKVRDADYVEYYVRYGPKEHNLWLKFMFGGWLVDIRLMTLAGETGNRERCSVAARGVAFRLT